MHIKSVVISGFKTYRDKQVIRNLHEGHNVISASPASRPRIACTHQLVATVFRVFQSGEMAQANQRSLMVRAL